jgi:hypothetical protein
VGQDSQQKIPTTKLYPPLQVNKDDLWTERARATLSHSATAQTLKSLDGEAVPLTLVQEHISFQPEHFDIVSTVYYSALHLVAPPRASSLSVRRQVEVDVFCSD